MRVLWLFVIGSVPLVIMAVITLASLRNRRFLAAYSRLETEDDVVAFRDLVTKDMYSSLALLAAFAIGGIVIAVGLMSSQLKFDDTVPFIIALFGLHFRGWIARNQERQLRDLPVGDEDLRLLRDHIIHVWLRHPFPDW